MPHTAPWQDPSTRITYNRGDPVIITGTVYEAGDATEGSWGYFSNAEFYFYSYYTADWEVRAPICIGTTAGTAWGFVEISAIVSGGTPETYTISFDASGGSGAPEALTKEYGKTLKLPTTIPTWTGHTFRGWGYSPGSTSVLWQPGANYTANGDATLYAIWGLETYTVSFDANGGSGAPAAQTKSYGVALTLPTQEPTRSGHTFNGWAKNRAGTGSIWHAGSTYTENAACTFYAVWIANTYTVSYDANGGSGAPAAQTSEWEPYPRLTISSTTPKRTGYTFAYWNTKKNGSGTTYYPGDTYTRGESTTLYAIWTQNKYNITFNASWDGGSPDTTKQVVYNATVGELPTARKKYYRFVGWFTTKTGNVQVTGDEVIRAAHTYYAHFVIDASVHMRTNGQEKAGFPYVYSGGEWKKGYCYARSGGTWKQGTAG